MDVPDDVLAPRPLRAMTSRVDFRPRLGLWLLLLLPIYSFRLGDRVLVASWLNRPGIAFASDSQPGIEVALEGLSAGSAYRVGTVDYVSGTRSTVTTASPGPGGTLEIDVPRTDAPILYLLLTPVSPNSS